MVKFAEFSNSEFWRQLRILFKQKFSLNFPLFLFVHLIFYKFKIN